MSFTAYNGLQYHIVLPKVKKMSTIFQGKLEDFLRKPLYIMLFLYFT